MSDWRKIKNTQEYREARQEIEQMINKAINPLALQLAHMAEALSTLEKKVAKLEAQGQKP